MKFKNKEIRYEAIFVDLGIGIVSDEKGNIFEAEIGKIEMPVNIDAAKSVYDEMQYVQSGIAFSDFLNNMCDKTEKQLEKNTQ